ncbi:hypothetical protein [Woeseia oceani]|uniref:Outer membrane protein beta-barrel domain-containing protein n=1 Tax=Woeseia oceani TaxID=1548547 RepID=A0A193LI71_9GAMM|nr:hypothetical protein [Woeseia oceani]ANO52089.1 hypothetical protein BA177_13565 [Woeseia oceani]
MTTSKTTVTAALVALLLSVLCQPAVAGKFDIVINGKSHHVNADYDWNEENLGLGLEYEFQPTSRWIKTLNANSFVDSLNNMSYMAGAGIKRRLLSTDRFGGMYFDAGVVGFLMARKDINDYRPFPGILPAVSIGNRYAGINLTYLPKKAVHDMAHANVVDPNIGGVIFMQFKFRMDAFTF